MQKVKQKASDGHKGCYNNILKLQMQHEFVFAPGTNRLDKARPDQSRPDPSGADRTGPDWSDAPNPSEANLTARTQQICFAFLRVALAKNKEPNGNKK